MSFWNFRYFKRGHHHQWDDHRGDWWPAHECEFPPEELWEEGDEIQCSICGKVRRFLEGVWREFDEFCDGNEPSA